MYDRDERLKKLQAGREIDLGCAGEGLDQLLEQMVEIFLDRSPLIRRVALHTPSPDLVEIPSLARDGLAPRLEIPNDRVTWVMKESDVHRVMDPRDGACGRIIMIAYPNLSFSVQSLLIQRSIKARPYVVVIVPRPPEYYRSTCLWTAEFAVGTVAVAYPAIETRSADYALILQRVLEARGAAKDLSPQAAATLRSLPLTSPVDGVATLVAIADRLILAVPRDAVTEEEMYAAIAAAMPEMHLSPLSRESRSKTPPATPAHSKSSPPPRRDSQELPTI